MNDIEGRSLPAEGEARPGAAVELDAVERRFPDGSCALAGATLRIERGEFIAVTGPSGSGKTTLLNIMGLLDFPTSGRCLIDGVDTAELTPHGADRLRGRRIGFIFQTPHVIEAATAAENTELCLMIHGVPFRARRRRAYEQLRAVGLGAWADHEARLLSGGQLQRLAAARALAGEPGLLLADEPTGSLDEANRDRMLALLRRIWTLGCTVVVVTHDAEVARSADRVVTIRNGVVADDQRQRPASLAPSGDCGETTVECPPFGREHPQRSAPFLPRTTVGRRRHTWLQRLSAVWRACRETAADSSRTLLTRPLRSALLVCAFAVGIGGLLAASALSQGAAAQIDFRLIAAGSDTVTAALRLNRSAPVDATRLQQAERQLGQLPHVRSAGFAVILPPDTVKVQRAGAPPDDVAAEVGLVFASARYLQSASQATLPADLSLLDSPRPAALVSAEAAKRLYVAVGDRHPVSAGTQIWINGLLVPVLGTFTAGPDRPHLVNAVAVNAAAFGNLPADEAVFEVRSDPGYPLSVAAAVPAAISASEPGAVSTRTLADLRTTRAAVSDDLSLFIWVLSTVLLLLAVISATAVTTIFVHARTQEIGLRRALGASRSDVTRLFLVEGLLVGFAGGAVGGLLGNAVTAVIGSAQGWPVTASVWAVPSALLLGSVTGLASAAYPAWIAGRKDPAAALKE